MNTAKMKNGGPAFPEAGLSGLPNGEFIHGREGMTLRDYFAAQAMLGYIAGKYDLYALEKAEIAYKIADQMLEERAK